MKLKSIFVKKIFANIPLVCKLNFIFTIDFNLFTTFSYDLFQTKVFIMKKLQYLLEKQAFGVCSQLGELMGVSSAAIRLFFIYATFMAVGSPIIVYMGLVFLSDMRKHFRRYKSTVWDV